MSYTYSIIINFTLQNIICLPHTAILSGHLTTDNDSSWIKPILWKFSNSCSFGLLEKNNIECPQCKIRLKVNYLAAYFLSLINFSEWFLLQWGLGILYYLVPSFLSSLISKDTTSSLSPNCHGECRYMKTEMQPSPKLRKCSCSY